MGYADTIEQRTTWKVTTAPASEPISVADAKTYLNVTTTLHNALITNIVSAARVMYEQYTDTAVISQTITQVWDYTPCKEFELGVSPLITSTLPVLSYTDTNGSYQTYDATNYTLDSVSTLPRLVKKTTANWPSTGDFPNRWRCVYLAGYAVAASVPEDISSSILLMVGFLYENREDMPINDTNNPKIRSFASLAFKRRMHLI